MHKRCSISLNTLISNYILSNQSVTNVKWFGRQLGIWADGGHCTRGYNWLNIINKGYNHYNDIWKLYKIWDNLNRQCRPHDHPHIMNITVGTQLLSDWDGGMDKLERGLGGNHVFF